MSFPRDAILLYFPVLYSDTLAVKMLDYLYAKVIQFTQLKVTDLRPAGKGGQADVFKATLEENGDVVVVAVKDLKSPMDDTRSIKVR